MIAAALALTVLVSAAPARASVDGLFAPTSYRNRPLGARDAIDKDSSMYVNSLANKVSVLGAWVNTSHFSTPVYTVGATQSTMPVVPDGSGPTDCLPKSNPQYVCLAQQWAKVPLPAGAKPAAGTSRTCDCSLVVHQPSTDTMWEFWRFRWVNGVPHARYGGRIENVSLSPGHYTNDPGRGFGAAASGIPLLAGLQRIDELQRGGIDHAINVVVHNTSSVYRWPAQRTDGTNRLPGAIQEGMRFRLPPTLDVDALGLSPYATMVAKAVQRFGMVVTDTTSAETGAIFYAEDPTPTGADPYPAIFGGQAPSTALRGFPWDRLQLLATGAKQPPLGIGIP